MENALDIPDTHQTTEVTFEVFCNIMDVWLIIKNDQKKLLCLTEKEYLQWVEGTTEKLPTKTLSHISHIFCIYKGLTTLFPNPKQAHAWPKKTNSQFNGQSAIDFILSDVNTNLSAVHDYIDEQLVGLGDF